jgi:hypothetical protein
MNVGRHSHSGILRKELLLVMQVPALTQLGQPPFGCESNAYNLYRFPHHHLASPGGRTETIETPLETLF